jgi:benzylsuccinate CoA-transferase BbsF subunit
LPFALEGIRILDFTDSIAGPFTTMLLANCGAEVIRVESRLHLGFRRNGPWGPRGAEGIPQEPEELLDFSKVDTGLLVGPTYAELNHDKLSIALNLSEKEGKEIFKKLVKVSDIIVENFSFGVMQKWGFDYENLKQIKEDIIDVAIPALGKGPNEGWSTWGMNLLSYSGFTQAWGHPETPVPERMASGFHGDYISGSMAAAAIVAALFYRAKTGKGQHLEVSQAEATVSALGLSYLDYFINDRIGQPMGNRHPQFAPYNCYPCKGDDCWCVIAIFNEDDWEHLCRALDRPQWSEDPKFKNMESRLKNVKELDRNISQWTRKNTPHQVMKQLQFFGVAAGAVQNYEDLYYDLQLRARGFALEQDLPRLGGIEVSAAPLHLECGQKKPSRHTSVLGEHNDYVYRQLLGMSQHEIRRLEEAKVIF